MIWRKSSLFAFILLIFTSIVGACNPTVSQETAVLTNAEVSEKRIAFVSARDGNYNIYAMNIDGTGQTRLTHNPASDWSPAWSPDGTKIAFVSDRDGNLEIYVMNADGAGQSPLTDGLQDDFNPVWQP